MLYICCYKYVLFVLPFKKYNYERIIRIKNSLVRTPRKSD